jgi:hypothetical protein
MELKFQEKIVLNRTKFNQTKLDLICLSTTCCGSKTLGVLRLKDMGVLRLKDIGSNKSN